MYLSIGIQRDLIARQLHVSPSQVRIWFQNRRRLQTHRDAGQRHITEQERAALEQGKNKTDGKQLRELLIEMNTWKNASPRIRLDQSIVC
jgi:hypothetical protein